MIALVTEARPRQIVRSLAEIMSDPAALRAPEAVVPRLAYRGRVTLLAAREKVGKSTLSGVAGAVVSWGGFWLGEPTMRGPVLLVSLEEHIADTANRAIEWGANTVSVFVVDSLATEPDPLAALRTVVDEVKPALVVVDTLAALVANLSRRERPQPGDSSAWTPVMNALTRIARETDAAVLLLHHANKSTGEYRDSTAIGAGVDVIAEMSEDPKDRDVRRLRVKARWKIGDYAVRFTPSGYELSEGELSIEGRVLAFVKAHPGCGARKVRDGVPGKASDVDAAVKNLTADGMLEDRSQGPAKQFYVTGHVRVSPENPQGHATNAAPGHECVPFGSPKGFDPGHTEGGPEHDEPDAADLPEIAQVVA